MATAEAPRRQSSRPPRHRQRGPRSRCYRPRRLPRLDAVKNLGSVAIPSLAASLREGPSPASRESLRRHLLETYEELKAYEETHPKQKVAQSKMEFVNTYMENYVAQYQIRAAQALAAIGGPEAQKGLSDALKVTLSDDVRIVVREALGRSKE